MRAKFVKSGWKLPGVGRRGAWGGARLTRAWEGAPSSPTCDAGSAAAAASQRRAGGNRLQPADPLQSDCSRGPALAAGTKVPRTPPDPLLGAAGAARSRPQPQDSRVWGGGGKVRRGGRERGREAGEETSERGEGRNRGASACSDPVLLRAAAADVPGSQRSRETRKRWQKRRGLHGESQCIPTGRLRLGRLSSTSQPNIARGPPCPLSAPWGRKGHRAEREARTVFIGRCTHCRGYAKDQRETTFSQSFSLPEVPIPLYCSLGSQPLLSRPGPPSWSTGWLQPSPGLDPTWASNLLDFALPRPCLK